MKKDIKLLAIDLAKEVFQVQGVDEKGRVVLKKKLTRQELPVFTANLPACRIVMESCGGSHYWARCFKSQGHQADLIAAQHVSPFRRSRQKNDQHDAAAIAEAAQRPSMRYVPAKSLTAQDMQSLHRVRQQLVKTRTSLINQCRGLAMEYGEVMPKKRASFNQHMPRILELESELTFVAREALSSLKNLIEDLDRRIRRLEQQISEIGNNTRDYARLLTVPGVGPLSASLLMAAVGDVSVFKNGRHMAAWLGLVPRQHSSGGQAKLGGITKAGDQDLRVMLIHGARALIQATVRKQGSDYYSQWILKLLKTKGWNVTAVAVANRNCRVMWHLLKYQEEYRRTA